MDNVTAAKILLSCLDLTSLNDTDTEYTIEDLCKRAATPYGSVAAVCINSKFIGLAKQTLGNSSIKVATVVNFPQGKNDIKKTEKEIEFARSKNVDEIDAVFPYREFLNGNISACRQFLQAVVKGCEGITSKLILETGEFPNSTAIAAASQMAIDSGVNFLKTSTGKTPVSATPEAANIMLETIAANNLKTGFKASGGIKDVMSAKQYLILAEQILGASWIKPENFRIGASSLLKDILDTIKRGY